MAEFRVLHDLPQLLRALPREVGAVYAAGQREALITWQQRSEAPGLRARFEWAGSAFYGFSMRRQKYGSPTQLRINYAKAGLGMPREARPGRGSTGLRMGASSAPNITKPWYVSSTGTRDRILRRRPVTRRLGTTITSRLAISGLGINFLGRDVMRGVTAAHWVKVPTTYAMTVYKDSVNRAGAYRIMVTRGIGRWFLTRATRSYKAEYEDTAKDMPFISRLAEETIRRRLRALTLDKRGNLKSKYRPLVEYAA